MKRESEDLEKVLSVSTEELSGFDWQDFLEEEAAEDAYRRMQHQLADAMTSFSEKEKEKKEQEQKGGTQVIGLDDEAIAKMNSYIELNYGRSYLTPLEAERINHQICTGAQADCTLYFTDGILANMVKVNAQSEYARRTKEVNWRVYEQNRRMAKTDIDMLTNVLKRALVARNEKENLCGRIW